MEVQNLIMIYAVCVLENGGDICRSVVSWEELAYVCRHWVLFVIYAFSREVENNVSDCKHKDMFVFTVLSSV